jgi:hypothetical protein
MGYYIDVAYIELRSPAGDVDNICRGMGATKKAEFIESIIEEAEGSFNSFVAPYYAIPIPITGFSKKWAFDFFQSIFYKQGQTENIPSKYKVTTEEIGAKLQKGLKDGTVIPPPDENGNKPESANETGGGSSIHVVSDMPVMTSDNFHPGFYRTIGKQDLFDWGD